MKNALITPAQARAARHSLVLSLKQLSEASNINRSYLSMFENGKLPLAQKYQQALVDCIEAIDWYIESFAPEMEKRGLGKEIGCYEDLMYRFMSVPDDEFRIKGRREDQLS